MNCNECSYYYKDENDEYERCHFIENYPAPCELNEEPYTYLDDTYLSDYDYF